MVHNSKIIVHKIMIYMLCATMTARQNARIKSSVGAAACAFYPSIQVGRALGNDGLVLGIVGNRREMSIGTFQVA